MVISFLASCFFKYVSLQIIVIRQKILLLLSKQFKTKSTKQTLKFAIKRNGTSDWYDDA